VDLSAEVALIDAGLQSVDVVVTAVVDAAPPPPPRRQQSVLRAPTDAVSEPTTAWWNTTASCVTTHGTSSHPWQHDDVTRHRRSQCVDVAFSVDAVVAGDRRAALQHLSTGRQRAQGYTRKRCKFVV